MDWPDRMDCAMDYIEENLAGNIDFAQAAKMACCSTYHFQRMFSFITGTPLSEYIRRRKLTTAAYELQNTNAKVIDIAFRFGYESSEAFSRAFHKLHGVLPTYARKKGVILKVYPRLSFHISIRGDTEMNYRIEEKEAFEVFGLELQTNVIDGQCYKDIPAFWEACEMDGQCVALAKVAGKKPNELLDAGVTYDHNPNGNMKYMIGCIKTPDANPGGYTVLSIPKQTWAIFSVIWENSEQGTKNIHDIWKRIYSEWFPSSHYEHAPKCDLDMELYYGDREANYGVEIWIPVIQK